MKRRFSMENTVGRPHSFGVASDRIVRPKGRAIILWPRQPRAGWSGFHQVGHELIDRRCRKKPKQDHFFRNRLDQDCGWVFYNQTIKQLSPHKHSIGSGVFRIFQAPTRLTLCEWRNAAIGGFKKVPPARNQNHAGSTFHRKWYCRKSLPTGFWRQNQQSGLV